MVPVQMSVLIGLKRTSLLQHEKPADVRSGSWLRENRFAGRSGRR